MIHYVEKRGGKIVPFDKERITTAITKAFIASNTTITEAFIAKLTNEVVSKISSEDTVSVEEIQNAVEQTLVKYGEYGAFNASKEYILYRQSRSDLRKKLEGKKNRLVDGSTVDFDTKIFDKLTRGMVQNCEELGLESEQILIEFIKNLPNSVSIKEAYNALLMATRVQFEHEPDYTYVAARLLQEILHLEINNLFPIDVNYFKNYIDFGIEKGFLDPKLGTFDLDKLSKALVTERDLQFKYLGMQTLYDRYLLNWQGTRFELPQALFMRVAMGLALNEKDKEARAIQFYNELSQFNLMTSTPTLFNAGTVRPQLSSCYVSTVPDSAEGIMRIASNNALLSKHAGGIGNDWGAVRGMGSHIKGTNGKSSGTIPFMKIAESVLIAFNQSSKRRGSGCAYLPTWHIDVEEFLELRKNTGDHRRRTHDMNTANWIPDLFMKRVINESQWTLFSPDETPLLHSTYGEQFETHYLEYERLADVGKIKLFKRISAVELWRKMLTMLFETGHPWLCWSCPSNIRNPQQHVGMIHSSNLCLEVMLNTDAENTAVCNLLSVNLANHIINGEIDRVKLAHTVKIGMRMLDNVIDINYYPIPEARHSNLKHRPVGLGLMGLQDALYLQKIPFDSNEAVKFSDRIMELISYHAIASSTELAIERGCYETFEGSLWSQGILPIDSIAMLKKSRDEYLDMDTTSSLDWNWLRGAVLALGMRNSNCMAIAPTATISLICGVSQSIEPMYQNLFIKTNLSGDFTVINPYLVKDLKALGLWDSKMMNLLKVYDGSIQGIAEIPDNIKTLYKQAFEIDWKFIVEAASSRQKWIDQSQSVNLYLSEPKGSVIDALFKTAWIKGLKTTYYLRTLGATHVTKNTVQQQPAMCSLDNPECESCQ